MHVSLTVGPWRNFLKKSTIIWCWVLEDLFLNPRFFYWGSLKRFFFFLKKKFSLEVHVLKTWSPWTSSFHESSFLEDFLKSTFVGLKDLQEIFFKNQLYKKCKSLRKSSLKIQDSERVVFEINCFKIQNF